MSRTGSSPPVTQVACLLATPVGIFLPKGVVPENHEKSILLAMKTELLEVMEKINSLLSKVETVMIIIFLGRVFGIVRSLLRLLYLYDELYVSLVRILTADSLRKHVHIAAIWKMIFILLCGVC